MSGQPASAWQCPRCGFEKASSDAVPNFFRPWHIRGPAEVKAYVESLGLEANEWLLALYVRQNDSIFELIAVDTVAQGDISSCPVPFGKIAYRGLQLEAEAFILVHNHPSGDPTPSMSDIRSTVRMARLSQDLDMPLLGHYVIANGEMRPVGYW
jgi:DNA repair protein RadC